jgi:hypothetical protein
MMRPNFLLREEIVQSNFGLARLHLERAFAEIRDSDELSVRAREALGLLIEACMAREHSRTASIANVARFPNRQDDHEPLP